jgi:ankyrin repeat protein
MKMVGHRCLGPQRGHVEVVEELLKKIGINPHSVDRSDRTPLSWASAKGHEATVRLLIESGKVGNASLRQRDKSGRTPLSWAAESGHETVVGQLLKSGDIDPSPRDECGQTPILLAVENGHEGVVRLLKGI